MRCMFCKMLRFDWQLHIKRGGKARCIDPDQCYTDWLKLMEP